MNLHSLLLQQQYEQTHATIAIQQRQKTVECFHPIATKGPRAYLNEMQSQTISKQYVYIDDVHVVFVSLTSIGQVHSLLCSIIQLGIR